MDRPPGAALTERKPSRVSLLLQSTKGGKYTHAVSLWRMGNRGRAIVNTYNKRGRALENRIFLMLFSLEG